MTARLSKLSIVTLALAALLHVAIVWAVPFAVMRVFTSRVAAQVGLDHILTQPLPTDKSRAVVTPSPDLLYATCVFDVGRGPVRLSMRPPSTYWSLSLFDSNTDNFFKLNAADLKRDIAEIVLARSDERDAVKSRFPAATLVVPPHGSGVMLARILVLDKASMTDALAAQQSVSCAPLEKAG